MKIVTLMGAALMTSAAFAAEIGSELAEKINAKRVIDIQPSQFVAPKTRTPMAVRFVRNGDFAPTCGLMQKSGKYIDLVSPEPGQSLPACATSIKAPAYFSAQSHYIVYEYQIEDPRAKITRTFQLFRVFGDEIESCKNDDQLTDAARKSIKTKGVAMSFKNAVIKFGCER